VSFALRNEKIADARVAVMGVADTPRRLRKAEDALLGMTREAQRAGQFAEMVRAGVSPSDDIHVSAEYRKNLIGALAEKALTAAWARAMGEKP
jgi:CO/xanthine dehydrogenase FAD-binding subunit